MSPKQTLVAVRRCGAGRAVLLAAPREEHDLGGRDPSAISKPLNYLASGFTRGNRVQLEPA